MVNALARPELAAAWHVGTQRRQVAVLAGLTVVASLASAATVLALGLVAVPLLLVWLALAAIVWRPFSGLYLVLGLVLLFEAGGPDPLMLPGRYLHWGFQSTLGLTGLIVSPLELLLLVIGGTWLAQGVARRRLAFRGGRLGWPMLGFFVLLAAGLVRGALADGDLSIAFWELRALLYLGICYLLAANTVRTLGHLRHLTALALVALGLFAVEAAYRRVALIDTGQLAGMMEVMYSHESAVLLGCLLLLVLVQQVDRVPGWQRWVGGLLVPVAGYALLATERRAGFVALAAAFLAISLVFLVARRKVFGLVVVPLLIGGAIYLPLFWNSGGLIGQPARALRSLSEPDPRDAASNLYRALEKINVSATIHAEPLMGVGFGREYLFVVGMPDLSWWPFWHYEPHHNILWVWLKAGAAGFVAFWVLMGAALARAAHLARTGPRPEVRIWALFTLATLTAMLTFCYVDLGLVSGRVTVLLGILLGTLSVLDQLGD